MTSKIWGSSKLLFKACIEFPPPFPLLNQSDNLGGSGLGKVCKISRQAPSDDTKYDALHSPRCSTYPASTSPSHNSQSTPPTSDKTVNINWHANNPPDLPYLPDSPPSPSTFSYPSITKPTHQFLQNARPRPLQSAHARLLHLPGLLLGMAGPRDRGDQGPEESGDQESGGGGETAR